MTSSGEFTPIIILGAGRSGTNVLRDVLTGLPDFATWPCDEIQPIWRHGNLRWPDDEFSSDMARPAIVRFVRNAFRKQWRRLGRPKFLVEKTCANTLRVPFIDAIFPGAKYIQILRHGADVVDSAEKRWRGELELPSFSYFLAKARFIPTLDIPIYLWSFASKRFGMIFGKAKHLSTWGPKFRGVAELQDTPLKEICARQWCACVEATQNGLKAVDQARHITLYYEDLVSHPDRELKRILGFLDIHYDAEILASATSIVRVKTGRSIERTVSDDKVREILAPQIPAIGYEELR